MLVAIAAVTLLAPQDIANPIESVVEQRLTRVGWSPPRKLEGNEFAFGVNKKTYASFEFGVHNEKIPESYNPIRNVQLASRQLRKEKGSDWGLWLSDYTQSSRTVDGKFVEVLVRVYFYKGNMTGYLTLSSESHGRSRAEDGPGFGFDANRYKWAKDLGQDVFNDLKAKFTSK